jgi:ribonucleotide reductase alpha subunit
VVVYSHETDEQEEKRKEDYFYDNKEIDGKIVAQEKAEPRKEKEKNGAFVKDLEDKRRDLNNKKKVKNHKLDLKEKEEAEISEETKRSDAGNKRPVEKKKLKKGNKKEKEEVEGPAGVVKGLFLVLHEAVTVVVFMALGAMMYSTWKEL